MDNQELYQALLRTQKRVLAIEKEFTKLKTRLTKTENKIKNVTKEDVIEYKIGKAKGLKLQIEYEKFDEKLKRWKITNDVNWQKINEKYEVYRKNIGSLGKELDNLLTHCIDKKIRVLITSKVQNWLNNRMKWDKQEDNRKYEEKEKDTNKRHGFVGN